MVHSVFVCINFRKCPFWWRPASVFLLEKVYNVVRSMYNLTGIFRINLFIPRSLTWTRPKISRLHALGYSGLALTIHRVILRRVNLACYILFQYFSNQSLYCITILSLAKCGVQ